MRLRVPACFLIIGSVQSPAPLLSENRSNKSTLANITGTTVGRQASPVGLQQTAPISALDNVKEAPLAGSAANPAALKLTTEAGHLPLHLPKHRLALSRSGGTTSPRQRHDNLYYAADPSQLLNE